MSVFYKFSVRPSFGSASDSMFCNTKHIKSYTNLYKTYIKPTTTYIFYYFLLYFVIFWYALLCFAMLFCYVLLCFAMFCYVLLPFFGWAVGRWDDGTTEGARHDLFAALAEFAWNLSSPLRPTAHRPP